MQAPSQSQVFALLRYLGTSILTIAPLFLFAGLSPDQAHKLVESLQLMVHGFGEIATGGFAVAAIVGPILGGWLIKMGVSSANPLNQIKSIIGDPAALKQAAQQPAVVSAVADSPAVTQKIVTTPAMAAAATSNNVISK